MYGAYGDGVTALVADGPADGSVATLEPPAPGADVPVFSTLGLVTAVTTDTVTAAGDAGIEGVGCGCCGECTGAADCKCCASCAAQMAAAADPPDPPPLGLHDDHTGTHTHEHAHGDGTTHSHAHFHNDSAVHNHAHGTAVELPNRQGSNLHNLTETERRRFDGGNEITDPEQVSALVAAALNARGITAATRADGTVEPAAWHAYLCAEGIRTDDGREIMENACRFPDLPVSLRLLVEDEGGHWGAVTCGRIDAMGRVDVNGLSMIYSDGVFGSDENGQLAELLVTEQTQRFISIDPRDVTAEYIVVEIERYGAYDYDDGDDAVYDCWTRYMDLVIGAATIVAMPALPQCVITLSDVDLPTSDVAVESAPPSLPESMLASAAPLTPPSTWFENPTFHVGDPRLVRQRDGKYACPLTVTDDGRVFGHVAYWGARHTGFTDRVVTPPRSRTGYAAFLTGACPCDDASCEHAVGQVTMGCGHAPLTKNRGKKLALHEVKAHYDGGYGAVQMADVMVGEDDFGIWCAGALKPGVTDEQVRDFKAMGVSGDWRDMANNLEMLAVLSVPAPGFPIARRALVAAGTPGECEVDSSTRWGEQDDKMFALVAAGVVARVDPLERMVALEQAVEVLMAERHSAKVDELRASLA